ncbi:hypothetical protein GCM10009332_12220 [Shewanella gelidii]|uniref:Tetratricopeptide repeat protein n=1 Tax=Shewanella gelidii TaxID=1642821 RepID=A0A917N9Y9_9GAMM|nr:hypothetical protein GCM10009332_12220 [Shewanella gelidii]
MPNSQTSTQETNQESIESMGEHIVAMMDTANTASEASDQLNRSDAKDRDKINGNGTSTDTPSVRMPFLDKAKQMDAQLPPVIIETFKIAKQQMNQQQWTQAEASFDQIIQSHPHLSGTYVNKAIIALQRAKQKSGLASWSQLSPDDPAFHVAEQLLKQAITYNSSNAYAHQIRGQVARLAGQLTLAEQSYRKALVIWPDYPEAQLNLAIFLELFRGQLIEARGLYQAYLSQKPDDSQAQRWLAAIELKIDRAGLTPSAAIQGESAHSLPAQPRTSQNLIHGGA